MSEREIIEQLARWIAMHKPEFFMDWACKECVPHSDMLREGFQCSYHLAVQINTARELSRLECEQRGER